MTRHARLSGLAAALLAALAIGASLPLTSVDASPLWSGAPTAHAAATKVAVVLLLAILLWSAATAMGIAHGVAEVVGGALVLVAVVSGPPVGSGGALIGLIGLLAVGSGLMAAALSGRS